LSFVDTPRLWRYTRRWQTLHDQFQHGILCMHCLWMCSVTSFYQVKDRHAFVRMSALGQRALTPLCRGLWRCAVFSHCWHFCKKH